MAILHEAQASCASMACGLWSDWQARASSNSAAVMILIYVPHINVFQSRLLGGEAGDGSASSPEGAHHLRALFGPAGDDQAVALNFGGAGAGSTSCRAE